MLNLNNQMNYPYVLTKVESMFLNDVRVILDEVVTIIIPRVDCPIESVPIFKAHIENEIDALEDLYEKSGLIVPSF